MDPLKNIEQLNGEINSLRFQERKLVLERNKKIAEYYEAGGTTEQIRKACGFTSSASVLKILRESGFKGSKGHRMQAL